MSHDVSRSDLQPLLGLLVLRFLLIGLVGLVRRIIGQSLDVIEVADLEGHRRSRDLVDSFEVPPHSGHHAYHGSRNGDLARNKSNVVLVVGQ